MKPFLDFPALRLCALLFPAFLAGCATIYDRAEVFTAAHTEKVGDADLGVEFVPTDSGAGVAVTAMVVAAVQTSSYGPYRVAIYAVAPEGAYESLSVTSLRFDTGDGRSWTVPASMLGSTRIFFPCRARELRQAACIVPVLLNLDFDKYPAVTVTATVRLTKPGGQTLVATKAFRCERQKRKVVESYFLPSEIVESFRMNDVPLDHMEIGVNRRSWRP